MTALFLDNELYNVLVLLGHSNGKRTLTILFYPLYLVWCQCSRWGSTVECSRVKDRTILLIYWYTVLHLTMGLIVRVRRIWSDNLIPLVRIWKRIVVRFELCSHYFQEMIFDVFSVCIYLTEIGYTTVVK